MQMTQIMPDDECADGYWSKVSNFLCHIQSHFKYLKRGELVGGPILLINLLTFLCVGFNYLFIVYCREKYNFAVGFYNIKNIKQKNV